MALAALASVNSGSLFDPRHQAAGALYPSAHCAGMGAAFAGEEIALSIPRVRTIVDFGRRRM